MKKDSLKRNVQIINEHINLLRQAYNVKNIGIFGSVARGEHTKQSDIDIIVEFSEPVGFFKFIALEEFLTKVLGKKVDLVTKGALKPIIKQEILKEVVYA